MGQFGMYDFVLHAEVLRAGRFHELRLLQLRRHEEHVLDDRGHAELVRKRKALSAAVLLAVLAIAGSGRGASVGAAERTITFTCANAGNCDISCVLVIRHPDRPMRKVPVVGGIARIDGLLGTAGESDIEIEAPNYWMPPQRLDLSSSSLRLPVWRTAIVRGRF